MKVDLLKLIINFITTYLYYMMIGLILVEAHCKFI